MVEDRRYIEKWMSSEDIQTLKSEKDGGRRTLIANGLTSVSRALEITKERPPNPKYLNVYGALLAMSGRLEEAKDVLQKVVLKRPDMLDAKITLGAIFMRLSSKVGKKGTKNTKKAQEYLISSKMLLQEVENRKTTMLGTPSRIAEVYFNLAIVNQKLGSYDEALDHINNAFLWLDRSTKKTASGKFLFGRFYLIKASILADVKNYDAAIDALFKAKQSGFPRFQHYLKGMRQFRPLRGHPRFKELIEKGNTGES
jgi:tetratricopeptide (TPR) repeat protein